MMVLNTERSMMMKPSRNIVRFASVGVGASVAALTLIGCSSSGTTAAGNKTLVMQVEQGAPNPAIAQAFAHGFEASHPGVKIKFQSISSNAVQSTNITAISSPNPPDLGTLQSNTSQFTQLAKEGLIDDISSVWNEDKLTQKYPASLTKLLDMNGKYYTIGLATGYYDVIYYNKGLFKADGISTPSDHRIASPQALYDIVSKLKSAGTGGIAVGGKDGYPVSWMMDSLLPTSLSTSQLNNVLTNFQPSTPVTTKYTATGFVASLTQLNDFNKNGVYQSGFLGSAVTGAEAAFAQGQTGMLQDGYWAVQAVGTANPKLDLGWLLLPPVEGSTTKAQLTSYFSTGYVIPSKSKNQTLAKEFIAYMASEKGQEKAVLEAGGQIPALTTIDPALFSKLDPLVQEMIADATKNGQSSGWTSFVPASVGQAFVTPLIQQMYAGQTTPEAIASKLQTNLDAVRTSAK